MPSDSTYMLPARRKRWRDSMRFFGRFLSSPGSVGAVLPSSKYLANAMVRDLYLAEGDLVLEYGPGTGPMTLAIQKLELAKRGADYLGIELDGTFHAALEARFPDMSFVLGSVADIEALLAEHRDVRVGSTRAKAIISGLPFASMPTAVQEGVVDGTHSVLAEDGEFRTFQYVHAYGLKSAQRFRAMMAERFSVYHRSAAVLRNVPPAYILSYRKN